MRRRDFIALSGGAAAAWPLAARAQQPARPRTIAVLMVLAENDPDGIARVRALREGLAALGWVDGRTARIVYRWAGGQAARIDAHVAELLALKPDVILANGTPVLAALKRTATAIPIVFALVVDPVRLGLVASLARPGGNITGFTFVDSELVGKWRQFIGEAAPSVRHAALLFNPRMNGFYHNFLQDIAAAPQGPVTIAAAPVTTVEEMRAALAAEGRRADGSLIIGPDVFAIDHIEEIAALALRHKLPGISVYRQFAAAGGLMSYGPDLPDVFRRAATYVDRILKGADPATLPVQQPTKYDFAVNLRTAAALGLPVAPALLARADEVIE